METNMFENINLRKTDEKNKHYNKAYQIAYEEIEEAIDYFMEIEPEDAAAKIRGYVRGKLDLISNYEVNFMDIKF